MRIDVRRTYDAEVICLEIPTVEIRALAVADKGPKLDPIELVFAPLRTLKFAE
jgi:hypothetical protein